MLERAVRRAAEVEDEMAATEAMLRTVEQRADQLQEEKDALCKLVKRFVTASMGPIIVGVDQLSCMSVGEIESLLEHSMP
jgi:predicted dinucleotide-utilizing enzyme